MVYKASSSINPYVHASFLVSHYGNPPLPHDEPLSSPITRVDQTRLMETPYRQSRLVSLLRWPRMSPLVELSRRSGSERREKERDNISFIQWPNSSEERKLSAVQMQLWHASRHFGMFSNIHHHRNHSQTSQYFRSIRYRHLPLCRNHSCSPSPSHRLRIASHHTLIKIRDASDSGDLVHFPNMSSFSHFYRHPRSHPMVPSKLY